MMRSVQVRFLTLDGERYLCLPDLLLYLAATADQACLPPPVREFLTDVLKEFRVVRDQPGTPVPPPAE